MQHLDEGTLQAWLDGARSGLDPSKLASIERHVGACDACAARADALARSSFRTHALLSVGRDQYAPRVPYEDVAKRARGSRTRVRSRLRRIQVTWAASILCAIGLGWISNELYHANDAVGAEAVAGEPATATQPGAVLAENHLADPASLTPESPASVVSPPSASPAAAGTSLRGSTSTFASQTAAANDSDGLVVRGFVGDEGGRPVPSAQVYVAALDVAVLTQEDGRYDLRLPSEPESFEITVQRIGFRQQTRALSGGEGDDVAADFRLREEALALDEIIVTGESDGAQRSTGTRVTNVRAAPFVWRPAPSIAAEGHVGSELWMLPGLDILALEVAYGGYPNETHVARVRLDLGDGKALTLVQGRTDGRRIRWPIQSEGTVLSTRRGEMLITATAPVSADSLRALLDQLR
jgi:anti-sigma factor RsiW